MHEAPTVPTPPQKTISLGVSPARHIPCQYQLQIHLLPQERGRACLQGRGGGVEAPSHVAEGFATTPLLDMSSPEPRLLTSTGNVDDRRQPAKEAPRSPLPHDSPPPLFPRSRRLTDPHPYRRRFRGSFNDSHQCLSSAAAAEAARPEAAARPLERHTLLRFLIDSRQIETHPYLVPFFSSSAAVAEASPRPAPSVASQLLTGIEVSENTQICWIPTDKRRSWTFILYPSEHGSKGGWWRKLLTYASYVLLAGMLDCFLFFFRMFGKPACEGQTARILVE